MLVVVIASVSVMLIISIYLFDPYYSISEGQKVPVSYNSPYGRVDGTTFIINCNTRAELVQHSMTTEIHKLIPYAFASTNKLTQLFGNTTKNFNSQSDDFDKRMDAAVLHNNTITYDQLKKQREVLDCIDNVFMYGNATVAKETVSSCDLGVVDDIVHHSLGNETMAHQYLLARGIK